MAESVQEATTSDSQSSVLAIPGEGRQVIDDGQLLLNPRTIPSKKNPPLLRSFVIAVEAVVVVVVIVIVQFMKSFQILKFLELPTAGSLLSTGLSIPCQLRKLRFTQQCM